MATYKNRYTKQEDEILWELHNIRHRLHRELKGKRIHQINRKALAKYDSWIKHRKEASLMA